VSFFSVERTMLPTARRTTPFFLALFGFLLAAPLRADEGAPPEKAKTRAFLFIYSATITDVPAGKTARIWLPVAQTSDDQDVEIVSKDLPAEGKIGKEEKYGNQILYVEAKPGADGTIPLKVTYRVKRREVLGPDKTKVDETKVAMYLKPDALVPIDGKPLDLIKGKDLPKDQNDAAHVLYDIVNNHMKYSKEGTGWGRGDSVWACDSKYGNCTDFHSLFISLARSQKIPAKFEIGFPVPEKRGEGEIPGYHCWAFFRPEGNGWVPVDISEANKVPKMKDYYFGNLTPDRVTFTTGRDLTLVPKQDGGPVNFLVYPYVEVDGKPYAADKIKKKFSYEDVK
jgi:transglutaminase-like putative cysteine protease